MIRERRSSGGSGGGCPRRRHFQRDTRCFTINTVAAGSSLPRKTTTSANTAYGIMGGGGGGGVEFLEIARGSVPFDELMENGLDEAVGCLEAVVVVGIGDIKTIVHFKRRHILCSI